MEYKISSNIRVNESSWEKLKQIAQINKRSINKEIEYIIDKRIEEFEDKLQNLYENAK